MISATLFMLFFFSFLLAFISLVMFGEAKIFYTTIIPDPVIRRIAWYSILFSSVAIIFGMLVHER